MFDCFSRAVATQFSVFLYGEGCGGGEKKREGRRGIVKVIWTDPVCQVPYLVLILPAPPPLYFFRTLLCVAGFSRTLYVASDSWYSSCFSLLSPGVIGVSHQHPPSLSSFHFNVELLKAKST